MGWELLVGKAVRVRLCSWFPWSLYNLLTLGILTGLCPSVLLACGLHASVPCPC